MPRIKKTSETLYSVYTSRNDLSDEIESRLQHKAVIPISKFELKFAYVKQRTFYVNIVAIRNASFINIGFMASMHPNAKTHLYMYVAIYFIVGFNSTVEF